MVSNNLNKRTFVAILAACSIPLVGFAKPSTPGQESFHYSVDDITSSQSLDFEVQGFNTSLGNLVAVEFTLNLDENAELNVQNTSNSSSNKFTNASASFKAASITLEGVPEGGGTEDLVVKGNKIDIGPESGTVGADKTKTYTDSDSNSATYTLTGPELSSVYTSGSDYQLDAVFKMFAADVTGSTKSANIFFGGAEDLAGCLDVTYIYSDCCCSVPEPSTWALMGLSLAGFAFLRRKKAKVS